MSAFYVAPLVAFRYLPGAVRRVINYRIDKDIAASNHFQKFVRSEVPPC